MAIIHLLFRKLFPHFWAKGTHHFSLMIPAVHYDAIQQSISDNILHHQPRHDGLRDANVKLMFVPFVFIVLRLWGTIRFLLGLVDYTAANSSYAAWVVPLQVGIVMMLVVVIIIMSQLVSWCFEPSQPQRITSGLL